MRIDVHAHYYAASYIEMLAEAGHDVRFAAQPDDLDDRLAKMDSVDVDVSIFSAIGVNTEVDEPVAAGRCVRHLNELYAELSQRYGGRLTGFASVPLQHTEVAIAEAQYALDELRLPGIALPCVAGGKPLDHEEYAPFWRYLGERGTRTVVYVHPVGTDSSCHPGLPEWGLSMLLGSTMQIAMAPLRFGYSGMTTRYPDLQFVFALCGGTLPYLWRRLEWNMEKGLAMNKATTGPHMFRWIDDVPFDPDDVMSLFRKNVWFDSSVQDIPDALRLARTSFGVGRILLGSDEIHASLTEAVAMIEGSPDLSAEEKHRILDVNAQELLQLPPLPVG